MADPLKNVQPGDPLVISAAAWNRLTRAALRAERQPKAGAGGDVPPDDILGPAVVVRVRNATGATLPTHSILTPTADVLDPVGDPLGARRRPVIDVAVPASADDAIVIAFDAIEYQKLGRAVAAGVTVANVQVTDLAHRYARPVPGDATKLASATSGPAYLLVPPTGTGTALRYVLLGAPEGGDSAPPTSSSGCGWLAALTSSDCLEVSILSEVGACDCASTTADKVKLTSDDGLTWSPTGGGGDPGEDCGACETQPETYAVTLGTGTGSYATVPTSWSLTRGAPSSAPCSWYQTQGAWTLTVTYSGGELQAILQGPASAQWITAAPVSCCGALGSVPLDAGGVGAPTCDAVTGTGGTC